MKNQNKCFLAMLSAFAVCGTAHAGTEIYGSMVPMLYDGTVSNATASAPAGGANQVTAYGTAGKSYGQIDGISRGVSKIGIRNSQDLDGGLQAIFNMEAVTGFNDTSSNWVGANNTYLGLKGGFGQVAFGQMDMPYKVGGFDMNALPGGQSNAVDDLFRTPGFNAAAAQIDKKRAGAGSDAIFNVSAANSIQYWSPNFNGLSFKAGYQLPGTVTTGSLTDKSSLLSTSVDYKTGDWLFRVMAEQHNNYFGLSQIGGSAPSAANNGATDRAEAVLVKYTHGPLTVVGQVEHLSYKDNDTAAAGINRYSKNSYGMTVLYKTSEKNTVWPSFAVTSAGSCSIVSGAACSTSGMGAKMLGVGDTYDFSKTISGYVQAFELKNDVSAQYSPVVGVQVPVGSTIKWTGVGMIYKF